MASVALVKIKPLPVYRRDAFAAGLSKLGYQVTFNQRGPEKGGVLVTWNLHGSLETEAQEWKRHGGKVLVAENGWIRGEDAAQRYSLARDAHNGAGRWWPGDGSRWAALKVPLKSWRPNMKGHILVVAQRGIGSKEMRSPSNWDYVVTEQIGRMTRMKILRRGHPGKPAQEMAKQIREDLTGACCCVIWAGGTGVRALIEGIPVFQYAPHWVCEGAAGKVGVAFPPLMDDAARLRALERMAWHQWTCEELASGIPFERLLQYE